MRVSALLVLLATFWCAAGVAAAPPSSFVVLAGNRYAALDGAAATGLLESGPACNTSATYAMPDGWTVAPADATARLAVRLWPWSTWGVILGDGRVYQALNGDPLFATTNNLRCTDAPDVQCHVPFCDTRILITQAAQPGDESAITQLAEPASEQTIVFRGRRYASTDEADPMSSDLECGDGLFWLPEGWSIAPECAETRIAALGHTFGTACLITDEMASHNARTGELCEESDAAEVLEITSMPDVPPIVRVAVCGPHFHKLLIRKDERVGDVSVSSWPTLADLRASHYADGWQYAVLDGTSPSMWTTWGCQSEAMQLPHGWELADDSTPGFRDAVAPTRVPWGTYCLLTTTGGVVAGNPDAACEYGAEHIISMALGSNTYLASSACDARILVRRPAPDTFTIGLRTLVLAPRWDAAMYPTAGVVNDTLLGYGAAFDVHETVDAAGNIKNDTWLNLEDAYGQPRYNSIVWALDPLSWQRDDGVYVDTLGPDVRHQLQQYQRRYRVRSVSLFTMPNALPDDVPVTARIEDGPVRLIFTDDAFTGPVRRDVVLTPPEGYNWRVSFLSCRLQRVEPWLIYQDTRDAAAVIVTSPDERTAAMHLFFQSASWHDIGAQVNHAWFDWVTRGVFVGERRLFLGIQVDDVFLRTGLFNRTDTYRISGDDLEFVKEWQGSVTKRLPRGSDIKLEMAFNGFGVEEHGGEKHDPLFRAVARRSLRDAFNWESHTWSHLDLTCPDSDCATNGPTSYRDARLDVRRNNRWARNELFPEWRDLHDTPNYSRSSMVTPRISGLFSGDALQAIWDSAIETAVGDNSRPELRPAHPWHGIVTTAETHGFQGFFIIPRHATDVFFDCSLPAENEAQYNMLYGAQFPQYQTWDDIVQRGGKIAAGWLLRLRHDPFMFHQANLRRFRDAHGDTATLVTQWADVALREVMRVVDLPVISLRQDELHWELSSRMRRDACGVSVQLHVVDGDASHATLHATGECEAHVTGLYALDRLNYRFDRYGKDVTHHFDTRPGVTMSFPLDRPSPYFQGP